MVLTAKTVGKHHHHDREVLEDAFDVTHEVFGDPFESEDLPFFTSSTPSEVIDRVQALIAAFSPEDRTRILARFCAYCGADTAVSGCVCVEDVEI